jgi:integrase
VVGTKTEVFAAIGNPVVVVTPEPPMYAARVTAHDLRHTAASLAIGSGANPKVVQRMLGHASAAMTLDVYADLFVSDFTADADKWSETVDKLWARGGDEPIQQTPKTS